MRTRPLLLAIIIFFGPLEMANAHVVLDAPNGGETFVPGEELEVFWHVAIQHDTIAWDVEYSTDGGTSWQDIAIALAPGDITGGAIHSFPWTIPDDPSNTVRVRVKQDNTGQDYYDMSDEDLVILPEPQGIALAVGAAGLAWVQRRRFEASPKARRSR